MLVLRADVAINHASSLRWRQPKQSNGMESFMILASHTVGCHARPMGSLAMTIDSKNPQKKRAQSYGEAIAQRRFEDCNL